MCVQFQSFFQFSPGQRKGNKQEKEERGRREGKMNERKKYNNV